MSCAKTAEPIEMPFGCGLKRAHVLGGIPDPPRKGAVLRGTYIECLVVNILRMSLKGAACDLLATVTEATCYHLDHYYYYYYYWTGGVSWQCVGAVNV